MTVVDLRGIPRNAAREVGTRNESWRRFGCSRDQTQQWNQRECEEKQRKKKEKENCLSTSSTRELGPRRARIKLCEKGGATDSTLLLQILSGSKLVFDDENLRCKTTQTNGWESFS